MDAPARFVELRSGWKRGLLTDEWKGGRVLNNQSRRETDHNRQQNPTNHPLPLNITMTARRTDLPYRRIVRVESVLSNVTVAVL